ncbi:hypothetical protein Lal_00008101 [Lupinus albus]|nr:hypothetical protein Lal_00008101 [Lupinus albus]
MFQRLISEAEKPLYDGCTKFTRLTLVSRLYKLKSVNGWIDKSFTDLLALLKDILPEDNVHPYRAHEAKQIVKKIYASYLGTVLMKTPTSPKRRKARLLMKTKKIKASRQ